MYNKEGIKEKEINYDQGNENDVVLTIFDAKGNKEKEGKMVDGKEQGVWVTYDDKGQKKEETTFKDGMEDGMYSIWYENGLKKAEGPNKGKTRVGTWTWWFESGEKWKEGNYNDSGKRIGTWSVWKRNGDLKEESIYSGTGDFIKRNKTDSFVQKNKILDMLSSGEKIFIFPEGCCSIKKNGH